MEELKELLSIDKIMNKNSFKKLLEQILSALPGVVITFVVTLLLPQRVFTILRSLLVYVIQSVWRYWYIEAILIGAALAIYFSVRFLTRQRLQLNRLGTAISLSFLLLLPTMIGLINDLIVIPDTDHLTLCISGCYSMDENGVLVVSPYDDYVQSAMWKDCLRAASKHYAFKAGLVLLRKENLPAFLPSLLGPEGLEKLIRWKSNRSLQIGVYEISDGNQSHLHFASCGSDSLGIANDPMPQFERDFSAISDDPKLSIESVLNAAGSYLIGVWGQSLCESMGMDRHFEDAQVSLNDSQSLIAEAINELSKVGSEQTSYRCERMKKYALAAFNTDRASLLNAQGEYLGAANCLIESFRQDPYYPLNDYETWKIKVLQDYAQDFYECEASLEAEKKDSSKLHSPSMDSVSDPLFKEQYSMSLSNLSFLEQLVGQHDTVPGLVEIVESQFLKIVSEDNNNPGLWFMKGDLFKYLRKGNRKINEIYVERFPECCGAFDRAATLDQSFPLPLFKCGALNFMEATVTKDPQKRDELLKKDFDLTTRALYLFNLEGINIRTDKSGSSSP